MNSVNDSTWTYNDKKTVTTDEVAEGVALKISPIAVSEFKMMMNMKFNK